MKKRNLLPFLALSLILVMTLCLCACGGEKKEEKETTSEAATTVPATTAVETTAPETTAPETDPTPILPTNEEMTRAASDLITACNTMSELTSGALRCDDNVYVSPEGYQYSHVIDSRFQNFGDINNFVNSYYTFNYASERYPWLVNPSTEVVPSFLYINDGSVPEGLYMVQAGKGFYYFDPNGGFSFSDVTENSFTISLTFDYFGTPSPAYIYASKENGLWKINGVEQIFN